MNRTYKSKAGLLFHIGIPAPFKENTVTFSPEEFSWLKDKNLSLDEFAFLWNAKRDDFRYEMIPSQETIKSEKISDKYASEIINQLKGVKIN